MNAQHGMSGSKFIFKRQTGLFSVLIAVGIALLPKCPLCFLAYTSLLTGMGVVSMTFYNWVLPTLLLLLAINLLAQGFIAKDNGAYHSFLPGLAGAAAVVAGRFWLNNDIWCYIGIGLMAGASTWTFVSKKLACNAARKSPSTV